jgi:hypothetical protein
LHGVDRVPFVVAITIPAGVTHVHRGIRVHRLNDMVDEHRATVDGIPTTTVERAVVDVASVFSRKRLEFIVDWLTVTERLTTVGRLARTFRQVNRRGRSQIDALAQVIASRSPHEPAPRSSLERRFDGLLQSSGLPIPLHEYPLPGSGAVHGLVDRCWPEVKLIVEIDGRAWHAREAAMAKDRARDRAAAAAGFLVVRFLDVEVRECPELVVADIVAIYQQRARAIPLAAYSFDFDAYDVEIELVRSTERSERGSRPARRTRRGPGSAPGPRSDLRRRLRQVTWAACACRSRHARTRR